jgi:hypothetical protein
MNRSPQMPVMFGRRSTSGFYGSVSSTAPQIAIDGYCHAWRYDSSMHPKHIPTDAAVKAWSRDVVAAIKEGNQSAKKRLRAHLRDLGHRGGLKSISGLASHVRGSKKSD